MKKLKCLLLSVCICFIMVFIMESFNSTIVFAETTKQATEKEVKQAKKAYKEFLTKKKFKDQYFKLVDLGNNGIPCLFVGGAYEFGYSSGGKIYVYKNKKVVYLATVESAGSSSTIFYKKGFIIANVLHYYSRLYFKNGNIVCENLADDSGAVEFSTNVTGPYAFERSINKNGKWKSVFTTHYNEKKYIQYIKKYAYNAEIIIMKKNTKANRNKYL